MDTKSFNDQIAEYLKALSSKPEAVHIVSSYTLSQQELDAIKAQLPVLSAFQLMNEIDETVLAGVIIKVGSLVLDATIKSKLKNYYKNLYDSL